MLPRNSWRNRYLKTMVPVKESSSKRRYHPFQELSFAGTFIYRNHPFQELSFTGTFLYRNHGFQALSFAGTFLYRNHSFKGTLLWNFPLQEPSFSGTPLCWNFPLQEPSLSGILQRKVPVKERSQNGPYFKPLSQFILNKGKFSENSGS